MKRELFLAGALTFTAAACAATTGEGVTYSDGCVPHTVTYDLATGDRIRIGVNNISFGENNKITDALLITHTSEELVLESSDKDETHILKDGADAAVGDELTLKLTSEEQTATLSEEGQLVTFTYKIDEADTAIVGLTWICQEA